MISLFASILLSTAHAATPSSTSALHAKAMGLNLHRTVEWQKLLHYRNTLRLGWRSDADHGAFVLTPDSRGLYDPKAELVASIESFYNPESRHGFVAYLDQPLDTVPAEERHPQCVFPARYAFLRKHLGPAAKEFPCRRYHEWRRRLDTASVTLVYATAYLGNPASTFGHTFLRLNSHRPAGSGTKGEGVLANDPRALLDYGVNYAAAVQKDVGFNYAITGIFGGFPGSYSLSPFHAKVQEYSQGEQRDLWEYDLDLTPDEVDRFVTHLWELGLFSARYYFFRRNCSFEILTALEYARPSLRFSDIGLPYVIPTEVVRIIAQEKGLVRDVRYRPSIVSRIQRRFRGLEAGARDAAYDALKAENIAPLQNLSTPLRAATLERAGEYVDYLKKTKGTLNESQKAFQREALIARSRIPGPAPEPDGRPLTERPDGGHDIFRVALGSGAASHSGGFWMMDIRTALHDLPARADGYDHNMEIESPRVRLRYERGNHLAEQGRERLRVESFDFNSASLSPRGNLMGSRTWRGGFGLETRRDIDCGLCNQGYVRAGLGQSWEYFGGGSLRGSELSVLSRTLVLTPYFFGEGVAQVSGRHRHGFRLGPQVAAGAYFDVARFWRMQAEASYAWLPLGGNDLALRDMWAARYWQLKFTQVLAPLRNFEVRTELSAHLTTREVATALAYYF